MFETEAQQLQYKWWHEVWKGYKPNVKNLHIFLYNASAHIPKDERFKMDTKAKKSIFLQY